MWKTRALISCAHKNISDIFALVLISIFLLTNTYNMRNFLAIAILFLFSGFFSNCKSGLVTMSNTCYTSINDGKAQNKSGNYAAALDNFNAVLKKCDAYDAKQAAYAGKAAALNGMGRYSEALDAASAGLKINPSDIDNLFERSAAEAGLGRLDDSKADLNTIITLTAKNEHVKERATVYAKIAEAEMKQGAYDQALQHIGQAISLDNSNLSFYMQQGDIHVAAGNLSAAVADYDRAIASGKDDAESWKAKTTTIIKELQKRYGTDNAGVLNKKISSADRQSLCRTIQTAQGKGMRDINIDLLQTNLCK
jgi:tetratricopeptide (TPR) repeat protein